MAQQPVAEMQEQHWCATGKDINKFTCRVIIHTSCTIQMHPVKTHTLFSVLSMVVVVGSDGVVGTCGDVTYAPPRRYSTYTLYIHMYT